MRRAGLFWGLWILTFAISAYALRTSTPIQPPLWQIPAFEIAAVTATDRLTLKSEDLRGSPWVAAFVYTRCAGPCPLVTGRMQALQKALPRSVRLVSFTVDPAYDQPKTLQRYAQSWQADPQRWYFARGDQAATYKLVYEGFRLAIAQNPSEPPEYRFTHSTHLILVDAQGFVRQFYDVNAENVVDQIRRDTNTLLRDNP